MYAHIWSAYTPASRAGLRGRAITSATGACQTRAETSGLGSLSRWRSSGVAIPMATAPSAALRRALDWRKDGVSPAAPYAGAPAARASSGSAIGPGMRSSAVGTSSPITAIRRLSAL